MAEKRDDLPSVRELAQKGRLVEAYEAAPPEERRRLRADAYAVLILVVFTQLTRRVEARRGHRDCMVGVGRLRPDCLDKFHDDMDAVLDDLFRTARTPIKNLEGWVSRRLVAVTIDAHRRRRGERGALQRPRIPRWLADELKHNTRLMELALEMLEWVGVEATAGVHDWPIEVWSAQRIADGDDYESASRSVAHDVAVVLAAMRKRPQWYADYVERPMGRKRAPLAGVRRDGTDPAFDPARAALEAEAADDARRTELAELAIAAIHARMVRGDDLHSTVVDVVTTVFGSGSGSEELDRVPATGSADDERMNARLADPETLERIIAVVRELLSR
jgi:hypothetical protein